MAKRLNLGIAIHNHQPVGNIDSVFADSTANAYLPMISLLERHTHLRVSLHYSGALLDWFSDNEPAILSRIAALARRGQIEIMSGGYYEPVLPAIPDVDKRGQIELMNEALHERFGIRATGFWLAEHVWEPTLPAHLANTGAQWTILDDSHFQLAGISGDKSGGYYITEDQGYTLKLFAGNSTLHDMVPHRSVTDVINYLRSEAGEESKRILILSERGDKFGAVPGSYDICWQQGWLEEFAQALAANADWLHLILPGEYARHFQALGRVYLPTSSTADMMVWSLPADDASAYNQLVRQLDAEGRSNITRWMRGTFWRNFLVKYPEANQLHKKMLRVHHKVYEAENTRFNIIRAGDEPQIVVDEVQDPAAKAQSRIELWQGQGNDAYWHGVSGGIYMADLRAAAYRHLLRAEALADNVIHGDQAWLAYQRTDYDRDSRNELLIEGNAMNLYIEPDEGGAILEWDYRAKHHNLTSSLTRRKEGYHQVLLDYIEHYERGDEPSALLYGSQNLSRALRQRQSDVEDKLDYDWYQRRSMIDHCLHPTTTLQGFMQCRYGEQGDFVDQQYRYKVDQQDGGNTILATLTRAGHIWVDEQFLPLQIVKRVRVGKGSNELEITIELTNHSELDYQVFYGNEWNLNLLGGKQNPAARYLLPGQETVLDDDHLDSSGELARVSAISLQNAWLDVTASLSLSKPARLWRFPVEAVVASYTGFEPVYQASCILPCWVVTLAAGQSWNVILRWTLS